MVAASFAGPAAASLPSQELDSVGGPVLRGATKVAPAGDVNGDGVPDLLASKGEFYSQPSAGVVYVVFGARDLGNSDLDDLGEGGFVIQGATEDDGASYAAPAGDVNGDGLDDVIVGAPGAESLATGVGQADGNVRANAGRAYVVFGKATTEPVELADFDAGLQGNTGFRIDGPSGYALAGRTVDGAGDVNGDGLSDLIVGAPFARAAYVVFGQTHGVPIDLATFGVAMGPPRGFRIDTPEPYVDRLMSVSDAGDFNGDGVPDVIVGVIPYDRAPGSAYVVFGKSDGGSVDVRQLGDAGVRLKGRTEKSATGHSVNSAGDVNADGLADVMVGDPHYPYPVRAYAYIVFGRRDPGQIRLRPKTSAGFSIKAERRVSGFGEAVSTAGDVNGDGATDFLVGAPRADFGGRVHSGAVYLVSGALGSRGVVDLTTRLRGALRIEGKVGTRRRCPPDATACWGDQLGATLASLGDVNGDGFDDFAVAALAGDRGREGAVHVMWGSRGMFSPRRQCIVIRR